MRDMARIGADNEIQERVGRRVRALRAGRGWTASQAAEQAKLSPRFYGQLEAGQANIALSRLARVAEAFGVRLGDLVEPEPEAWRQELNAVLAELGEDEGRRCLALVREALAEISVWK